MCESHAGVQAQACAALRSLALNDANSVKVAALGGIEAILKAMGTHTHNADVQKAACTALLSLTASNDANKVKVAAIGGVQAILDSGCSVADVVAL